MDIRCYDLPVNVQNLFGIKTRYENLCRMIRDGYTPSDEERDWMDFVESTVNFDE